MSQENVDVVRASIDAWNAGDMDAFVSSTTPTPSADPEVWPEPGPFVGRDAVMRQSRSTARAPGTGDALGGDQRLHRRWATASR